MAKDPVDVVPQVQPLVGPAGTTERPAAASWLQEIDTAAQQAQAKIQVAPPVEAEPFDPAGLVMLAIIFATLGVAGWLLVRSFTQPTPTVPLPGEGTRITFVSEDRRRYSSAGTSIISRSTAILRKGSAAFRKRQS